MKACRVCNGTGTRVVEVGGGLPDEQYRCRYCIGSGQVPERRPQPHEGVVGADREGWLGALLALDDGALAVRGFVIQLAAHLADATRVGSPAPKVARMAERMRSPQPGDLVVEASAPYRDQAYQRMGFGILLLERWEWWTTDEEWERTKAEDDTLTDDERSPDQAWYVQYGANADAVCRWTNCSFGVVPVDRDFFPAVPAGFVDGTGGTVFTRDSLLGSLADSGFQLRVPQEDGGA